MHFFPSTEDPDLCTFDEALESNDFSTSRGTGTLILDRTTNCWFILSYHLSFAIPNEMANVICRAINVFEKESKQVAAADAAMKATTELLSMLELEASSQASAEPTVKKKPKNKKKGK